MMISDKYIVQSFKRCGANFSKYCKYKGNEFFIVDNDNICLFDLSVENIKKQSFTITNISDMCYNQQKDIILCSSQNNIVCKTPDNETIIFETPQILDLNLVSVASHEDGNLLCAGAEVKLSLFEKGESDALLVFWDIRNPSTPIGYYKDSHSDNIVSLSFKNNSLLSGGEDGLINVYDISQTSEADALLMTINTEDTVNKCGWLPKNNMIYCFTGSEKLIMWDMNTSNCEKIKNSNFINTNYRFLADFDENISGQFMALSFSENSSSLYIDSLTDHYQIDISNEFLNNGFFINNSDSVVTFSDTDIFICSK